MRLVIIESPYAGDVERNVAYARACVADCLKRGEAPLASHILYTQPGILDDTIPEERKLGIEAGLAWGEKAEATVVYTELGVTPGMRLGIERARRARRPVEFRALGAFAIPGLTDHQREVLSAIEKADGQLSVTQIVKGSGVRRETAHFVLDALENMGLVKTEVRSGGIVRRAIRFAWLAASQ